MSQMLQNRNITTLVIGVLCAIKIILQAFHIDVITNTEVNQIADGAAALCTVIAVFMKHEKGQGVSPDTNQASAQNQGNDSSQNASNDISQ